MKKTKKKRKRGAAVAMAGDIMAGDIMAAAGGAAAGTRCSGGRWRCSRCSLHHPGGPRWVGTMCSWCPVGIMAAAGGVVAAGVGWLWRLVVLD